MKRCTLVFLGLATAIVGAHAAKQNYTFKLVLPEGMNYADLGRAVAQEEEQPLSIQYVTLSDKNGADLSQPKADPFDLNKWRGMSAASRTQRLIEFYYANTRDKSRKGLRHVACFTGHGPAVANEFFSHKIDKNRPEGIREIIATSSSDTHALGIQFNAKEGGEDKSFYFRILNCLSAGKMPLVSESLIKIAAANAKERSRVPAQVPDIDADSEASLEEQGFDIFDQPEIPNGLKVPTFVTKGDYDKAPARPAERTHRPWKNADISNAESAEKLTLQLLAYFYSGMGDQDAKNADMNLRAEENKKAYWCHMPWLNVGPAGREGIHGLTNERPLEPSPIYPNATPGSDWGIGFYNYAGCRTMKEIWGTKDSPKAKPDFAKGYEWEDNTISVKTLFTTAKFAALDGAFEWHANVSEPGSNDREVKPVRMIQIDIALKDSTIKGMNKAIGSWLMTTYYYDKDYDMVAHAKRLGLTSVVTQLKNVQPAMLKMRPVGVQSGMEQAESIIFAGSKTNQNKGLLNGPADNPKSSCLSCHATAGTKVFMAPGFTNNLSFKEYLDRKETLDFSQQLALGKRNYETRKRKER